MPRRTTGSQLSALALAVVLTACGVPDSGAGAAGTPPGPAPADEGPSTETSEEDNLSELVSPAPETGPDESGVPSAEQPAATTSPSSEPASAGPRDDTAPVVAQGRVVDIVDGDTIDLADGTRVRLAITDTPEVHGGTETCGPEASQFTGSFVAGQTVAIYRPDGAPLTDRYGRTVGEVVRVTDGASLNTALVQAGLARIDGRFTHEDPDLARRLETAAAAAATPACTDQEPQATPPPPEPSPSSEGTSTSGHTGRTDGGWSCHPAYQECLPEVDDLDCGETGHQVQLTGSSDPYRIDGNSTSRDDGVGCDSYGAWSAGVTYPYY